MHTSDNTPASYRIRPSWWAAIGVFIAVQLWMKLVPSESDGSFGADPTTFALILKLGVVAIAVAVAITFFKWWRPVLRDDRSTRFSAVGWFIVAGGVVAMFAAVIGSDRGAAEIAAISVVMIVAVVGEELLYRGVLLTGLRGSRVPEWAVWLVTTAMFAVVHFGNAGPGVPTEMVIAQVMSTVFLGSLLYACRRLTGGLLVPMLIHLVNNLAFGYVTEVTAQSVVLTIGISVIQFGGYLAVAGLAVYFVVSAVRGRKQSVAAHA